MEDHQDQLIQFLTKVVRAHLSREYPNRSANDREDWQQEAIAKLLPRLDVLSGLNVAQQRRYARLTARSAALDKIRKNSRDVVMIDVGAGSDDSDADASEDFGSSHDELKRTYQAQVQHIEDHASSDKRKDLRDLLDKIAWSQSSREHVHFWLFWLVELRANLSERVHDRRISQELFHEQLAQMVLWHEAEREHPVHKNHEATLDGLWDALLPALYRTGEYEAHQLRDALGACEVVASKNQVEQWLSRMRSRVGDHCKAQGVSYHELREALALASRQEVR